MGGEESKLRQQKYEKKNQKKIFGLFFNHHASEKSKNEYEIMRVHFFL